MTIEKGKEWGHRGPCPGGVIVVNSDRQLVDAWCDNPQSIFVVEAGDLHMALGQPRWQPKDEVQHLPVDVLRVKMSSGSPDDDDTHVMYALSSIEIGTWLSRRRFICVSNCGFIGSYNIAPRAHPNDGEMDVVSIDPAMDWRQRFQARTRARLGQHVPHPQISMERGVSHTWHKESAREKLRIDGAIVADWDCVEVSVLADVCTVVV